MAVLIDRNCFSNSRWKKQMKKEAYDICFSKKQEKVVKQKEEDKYTIDPTYLTFPSFLKDLKAILKYAKWDCGYKDKTSNYLKC